ncbi:MAG: metal ABC transporter ATP-binding protein [Ruminococcaceae bacterium]|nr:metal ABC transporter ATP-binding protein [Oscillospiraceae bacterium]
MDKLLECFNLCVNYEGKPILTDISFTVEENDFLCIVGENGAGKSTLTNAILGLVPIKSGSILLHGISKSDIGYLPQKLKLNTHFPASVKEVVMSGFVGKSFFSPRYNKSQRCRADDSMKLLGINDYKSRSFLELSGGQQQRVLLARAICAAEKLVFLDEPVTGLDPAASDNFYKLLSHLNSHHGVAIVMVSHDIENAVSYCNKILHLGNDNRFFGTTEEYKKSDIYKYYVGKRGK